MYRGHRCTCALNVIAQARESSQFDSCGLCRRGRSPAFTGLNVYTVCTGPAVDCGDLTNAGCIAPAPGVKPTLLGVFVLLNWRTTLIKKDSVVLGEDR